MLLHHISQNITDLMHAFFKSQFFLCTKELFHIVNDVIIHPHSGDDIAENIIQVFIKPVYSTLRKPSLFYDIHHSHHLNRFTETYTISSICYKLLFIFNIFLRDLWHFIHPVKMNMVSFYLRRRSLSMQK